MHMAVSHLVLAVVCVRLIVFAEEVVGVVFGASLQNLVELGLDLCMAMSHLALAVLRVRLIIFKEVPVGVVVGVPPREMLISFVDVGAEVLGGVQVTMTVEIALGLQACVVSSRVCSLQNMLGLVKNQGPSRPSSGALCPRPSIAKSRELWQGQRGRPPVVAITAVAAILGRLCILPLLPSQSARAS
jgi:hypothetical protein